LLLLLWRHSRDFRLRDYYERSQWTVTVPGFRSSEVPEFFADRWNPNQEPGTPT